MLQVDGVFIKVNIHLSEAGFLACPERGLARCEAGVEDEADAPPACPGLYVHPHPDVPGPLHWGRSREVYLLEDFQHPPLLLHLNIVHVEEERVVSDEVIANLDGRNSISI